LVSGSKSWTCWHIWQSSAMWVLLVCIPSVSLSFSALCDLIPWIHSTGIPHCLYIRVPAQTAVPIWVWLELSGICQLHPGLCPPRDYAPAMPVPRSARWDGQPHYLLLETAGCEAGLCHCVWGVYKLRLHISCLRGWNWAGTSGKWSRTAKHYTMPASQYPEWKCFLW
jgi:hypothetical protein